MGDQPVLARIVGFVSPHQGPSRPVQTGPRRFESLEAMQQAWTLLSALEQFDESYLSDQGAPRENIASARLWIEVRDNNREWSRYGSHFTVEPVPA